MFRILLVVLLLAFKLPSFAQEFGGFKPSKQWSQLKNENYRLVFSPELEATARKVAAIFIRMNQLDINIGVKRRNLNIILQNSTTQANGYVGLAPFVSEFFLTPYPVNNAIGTLPWHYTLGVHEYQHALQYANSYYGASKILHWFGGELAWGAAQSIAIPNWFFEGNAVLVETQYSEQGRGRIPTFFNEFRSFAIENKTPKYDKLRNGSFQDLLPDHYRLGYLMVRYGREKYGEEYWTNVLKRASSYSGIIYPFSRALKQEGGEHSRKMYKNMMVDLSAEWNSSEDIFDESVFPVKRNEVSNYYYPQFDTDSVLYFISGSYDNATAFYKVENGKRIKIRQAGIRSNNYFDVHNQQLLSTETHFDKRWGWIDYEDIVLYNVATNEFKQLTTNGKYFCPSFSNDGKKILGSYVHPNGTYEIHLLSADGTLLKKFDNSNQYYITEISSTSAGTFLANARDLDGKNAIIELSESGKITAKTKWTYHILGRPMEHNGNIYFEASFNGTDNIYMLQNDTLLELSSNGPGRYSPTIQPATGEIYFTEFSLNGIQLQKSEIPNTLNRFESIPPLSALPFYNPEFIKESTKISTKVSTDSILVEPYKKAKHLINMHSWSSNITQTDFEVNLLSDDVLNTLDMQAGWGYNFNEETNSFNFSAIYAKYYIHLNTFFSSQQRSINGNSNFTETSTGIAFSLPLNYSSKTFSRRLNLATRYNYLSTQNTSQELKNFDLHLFQNNFSYRQSKLKARKNIFTKLGFSTSIQDIRSFNKKEYQFVAQNAVALPGVFRNNSLVIEADLRIEDGETNYRFTDRFVYSRGFLAIRTNKMYRFSGNYHFPIAYPDKGALGIFYLLRIRGNLFFDYSIAQGFNREFNSTGVELIFDTKLLRLLQVPIGIRYNYLLSQKSFENSAFEVFIPVSRF